VWVGLLFVGVTDVQGVTAVGSGTSVGRHEIIGSVIRQTSLTGLPSEHSKNSDIGDRTAQGE